LRREKLQRLGLTETEDTDEDLSRWKRYDDDVDKRRYEVVDKRHYEDDINNRRYDDVFEKRRYDDDDVDADRQRRFYFGDLISLSSSRQTDTSMITSTPRLCFD
jgi:hypothetical protein